MVMKVMNSSIRKVQSTGTGEESYKKKGCTVKNQPNQTKKAQPKKKKPHPNNPHLQPLLNTYFSNRWMATDYFYILLFL